MPSLLVTLVLDASAATIHVPADQPTVTSAVAAALDGDTVLIEPGDWSTEAQVHIQKSITLRGEQGADETTLPRLAIGGAASVVLANALLACPSATESSVVVSGSSLRATGIIGRACTGGTAFLVFAAPSFRVEDSVFEQWTSPAGPVVTSSGSDVALVRVSATNTSAVGGDPLWFDGAGHGGVIASTDDVAVHLESCTFADTSAADRGGAVYVQGATGAVDLVGTTVDGATATQGGAVYIGDSGLVSLNEFTVTDTITSGLTGAVVVRQSPLDVDHGRFVGNGPATSGAALFASGGPIAVTRSLFCGNAGVVADLELLDATAQLTASGFAHSLGTSMRADYSDVTLTNATFVDTTGGAVFLGGADLAIRNVAFANVTGNALEGTDITPEPTGGYVAWDAVDALLLGDGWAPDALTPVLANTPPGLQGDSSSCTPEALWLSLDSKLRDQGDPALLDVDGSRSDIGMFGGPDADRADPDLDGDGFEGGVGPDCDDTDASVNPATDDPTVNGVDEDCDGFDGLPVDSGEETALEGVAQGGCSACSTPAGPPAPAQVLFGLGLASLLRRRARS